MKSIFVLLGIFGICGFQAFAEVKEIKVRIQEIAGMPRPSRRN